MSTNLQLPEINANGYWTINTISELVALAKNPEINLDNLLTDLSNFLNACRQIEFLSSSHLEWKDDGLQTINVNCKVISDSDPNEIVGQFHMTLNPQEDPTESKEGAPRDSSHGAMGPGVSATELEKPENT